LKRPSAGKKRTSLEIFLRLDLTGEGLFTMAAGSGTLPERKMIDEK
jgi:hypothetical protein